MSVQAGNEPVLNLKSLEELSEKVARVHGNSDPRLHQVRNLLRSTVETIRALQIDMDQLRTLTDAYKTPPKACKSYRGLFAGLDIWDQRIRLCEQIEFTTPPPLDPVA